MMMYFSVPAGVSLRLGWNGTDDNSAVGLGYTWWTGGSGFNTSISTAYDMVTTEAATNTTDGNLSVTVGFGF